MLITNPILEIELSKNYQINNSFIQDLMWTLGTLFNFIPTKSGIAKINNNKLYFETTAASLSSANYPNKFVDLSKDNEQALVGLYIEVSANEIFSIELEIKEKLIENNKNKIQTSWFEFLKKLNDHQKVEKIYDFILLFVSYGQKILYFHQVLVVMLRKKLFAKGMQIYLHMSQIFLALAQLLLLVMWKITLIVLVRVVLMLEI